MTRRQAVFPVCLFPDSCYDSDYMRVFFLLLFASLLRGQAALIPTLDDAVRTLAKNIAAQLAANEVAHLSERSPDPAFASETARARTFLDRALRRPTPRGAAVVEVVVTATENARGPMIVAEIQKGPDAAVETIAYRSQPAAAAARLVVVSRKLWEQDEPILDLATVPDGLAVLSPSGIKLCVAKDGSCEVKQPHTATASRDPRGRLLVSGDNFTAYFPENPPADFQIDGEQVHFTFGQNTLETQGGDKFYSVARTGSFRLAAEVDGRVHVSQGSQKFVLDGWGSDVVSMPGTCASGALVIASSPSEGDAADSVTAYELSGQSARAASEPLMFGGPLTALWPSSGGAIAVVRQGTRYAAYSLTLDCTR
jgi:hypothetical protein